MDLFYFPISSPFLWCILHCIYLLLNQVDSDQITQSASCLYSLKHLTLSGCDTCISKGLLEVPIPLKTLTFTIRNQRELEYVLKHKQRNALLSNMDISNVKPRKQLCQLLDHSCVKGIEVLDFEFCEMKVIS